MKNHLLDARQASGLTQEELAALANTSQSQIQKLENGKRKLTKEWAERLSTYLNVSPHVLLFGNKSQPEVDKPVTIPVKLVPLV